MIEGDESSRGDGPEIGTYLGNTTNGVEKELDTNLSRAFVSGTGPQIDEEEEEEDADDYPIGKYDPFPLTRRDPSFDRLNTLFFPCGTQAPPPTPATASSRKRKAAEQKPQMSGALQGAGTGTAATKKRKKDGGQKKSQDRSQENGPVSRLRSGKVRARKW